ncbi:hypothetical protein C0991_005287 [Blastosporella zonata]|nr:hypothetical protein C0991_005287 [Blastosporella zonata]
MSAAEGYKAPAVRIPIQIVSCAPTPTFLYSTTPNTSFIRMRPSSRLLVPTLTILSWSMERAYASFRPPAQSIYNRQVRSADYSTSTRPSYDGGSSATPPGTDTPSTSKSSSSAPQTSKRAFFSTADRQVPDYDSTFGKVYSGSITPRPGIAQDLAPRHALRKSRRSDNKPKARSSPVPQVLATRDVHRQTRSGGDQQRHRAHTKDSGYRRKKRTPRRHRTRSRGGRKNLELHALKERKGAVRRSDSINLRTLHIARGINRGAHAVDPTPSLPAGRKSVPAMLPSQGLGPSSAPAPKDASVPKSATVTFVTPDKDNFSPGSGSQVVNTGGS